MLVVLKAALHKVIHSMHIKNLEMGIALQEN